MSQNPPDKPYCKTCHEYKTEEDHDASEKHLKNRMLFEYNIKRTRYYEEANGIIISCSAESSFATLFNCIDSKLKISVRPGEQIKFNFSIKNDNICGDLFIYFVKLVHKKLGFTMNDHGLGLGCTPQCVRPNEAFGRDINVFFSSPNIGQYVCPVMFSLKKMLTKEVVFLLRDVVVYVEDMQSNHDLVESPFASKSIYADIIYRNSAKNYKRKEKEEEFPIPSEKKEIFANKLQVGASASQEGKALTKKLETIFSEGTTRKNYQDFFHNLLWFEETIAKIQLKKYNMSEVRLIRVCDTYLLEVPGLAEKRPSLMLGDMVFVKPSESNRAMFEGIIGEIQDESIYIRGLHAEFRNHYSTTGKYDVRFFTCRIMQERMHKVLQIGRGEKLHRRVFPKRTYIIPKVKPITKFYNGAIENNVEQRKVVEHILAGTCGTAPYLIHGPPGTGKTVTVVETILQIIKREPGNRVLVCTDSNMAADHVALQLCRYASHFPKKFLLRANARLRTWETMPEALVAYSNGSSRSNWTSVPIQKFKSYPIVVTTISHSALYANIMRERQMQRHITHLFIDEAAQALEPLTLLPTCGLLSIDGTMVLAGDPLQLGPVVISNDARNAGLGTSLMERLKNTCPLYKDEQSDPNYILMLRNNFRSHPDIIELPNQLFYDKQLRCFGSPDPLSNLNILQGVKNCRAVVFHAVLSSEQKFGMSPSYFNTLEQMVVRNYVNALVKTHKVPLQDIGVVTPYVRQMHMIRNWLHLQRYEKIEVGTVEAFQGKEKRVILISTVRANCDLLSYDHKFQLGFLVDNKRFNVALTRAKAKVVVIGNPLCLMNDYKWASYILKCREIGSYYGFDYETVNNSVANPELASTLNRMVQKRERRWVN